MEILLADKTQFGPDGRPPLSSSFLLEMLLEVCAITNNLSKLETYCNIILDSGGIYALVSLLNEFQDEAAINGVHALYGLVETSKKCAVAICKYDSAIVSLLNLCERYNLNVKLAAMKLLKLLFVSENNLNSLQVSKQAVEVLLRLIRFEYSEDLFLILLSVAGCNLDENSPFWTSILETNDVSTTMMILNNSSNPNLIGNGSNVQSITRLQAKSLYTLGHFASCSPDGELLVSETFLNSLPLLIVKLLIPNDNLGSDKSEYPILDVLKAISKMIHKTGISNIEIGFVFLFC